MGGEATGRVSPAARQFPAGGVARPYAAERGARSLAAGTEAGRSGRGSGRGTGRASGRGSGRSCGRGGAYGAKAGGTVVGAAAGAAADIGRRTRRGADMTWQCGAPSRSPSRMYVPRQVAPPGHGDHGREQCQRAGQAALHREAQEGAAGARGERERVHRCLGAEGVPHPVAAEDEVLARDVRHALEHLVPVAPGKAVHMGHAGTCGLCALGDGVDSREPEWEIPCVGKEVVHLGDGSAYVDVNGNLWHHAPPRRPSGRRRGADGYAPHGLYIPNVRADRLHDISE